MKVLDAGYYKRGDRVSVRFQGQWNHGRVVGPARCFVANPDWSMTHRVIGQHIPPYVEVDGIRVVFNVPREIYFNLGRAAPSGTAMIWSFSPDSLVLNAHDPAWNPYLVQPSSTPNEYRVISGVPRQPRSGITYAILHRGAYLDTGSYEINDPVWAWDGFWLPAVVRNVGERWISVSYSLGHRDRKGGRSKSFRTSCMQPVVCDYPGPIEN